MITAPAQSTIHDGYYTIPTPRGHKTFRVHTQPPDALFAPGKRVISYLFGPDNGKDYRGFGFVVGNELRAWKRFQTSYDLLALARGLLETDGSEYGRQYAMRSGNCYVCNRLLTTPESIAAGIGPTCASRI